MLTGRTRRKEAIYNGIALSAVGIISLLFAGIQGSEAARLESDRITTQGIILRKFRDRRQTEARASSVRIIEVRYLSDLPGPIENRVQTEASNFPFDSAHDSLKDTWSDRPPLSPNSTREDIEFPAEAYQTLLIEVLSSSLFERLQEGMVVNFSYSPTHPESARLSDELALWRPPVWEYGVMGITFGGAAYFFLKALFMRRGASQQRRSAPIAKR